VTRRRLELLQWYAFAGAALAWAVQLVLGFGVTQARCSPGGGGWSFSNDAPQLAFLVAGVLVALGAEAAAAAVFVRTLPGDDDDPPPDGRLHFLATASLVANVLFIMGIVLSGSAAVAGVLCRQA
jgi:hypothetical protein